MKRTPLQEVRERFGGKNGLIKELAPMLRSWDDESQSELENRLTSTPNKKLLHLHRVETELKEHFGSREKLADAICKLQFGEHKVDLDFRTKLLSYSTAKLLDRHRVLSRR